MSDFLLRLEDALKLETDNSAANRRAAGEKIGQMLAAGKLTRGEAQIAEDVIARLASDADHLVRAALARHIAHYPLLPASIAENMARDVVEVSVHVLEHCPGLTDELLISVINEEVEAKQVAIARRAVVSEQVSDALIDTRNPDVVSVLLDNAGAAISEPSLKRALDDHGDHPEIPVKVAKRPGLTEQMCLHCVSLCAADRMEAGVAEEMRTYLIRQQNLPEVMASEIVAQAREQAVADMTAAETDEEKVAEFVTLLGKEGRLTPTLLIRSLCSGDLRFVELAFARLSKQPVAVVRAAFASGDGESFRSLYAKTTLPTNLRPAFNAAIKAAAKERRRANGDAMEPQRYVPVVIAGIVSCYGNVAPAELEHVLAELNQAIKRDASGDHRLRVRT